MATTAAAECNVRRSGRLLQTVDTLRATVVQIVRAAKVTTADLPVGGRDAVCGTTKNRGRGALGASTGAEGSPPKQSRGALVGPTAATPAAQASLPPLEHAPTEPAAVLDPRPPPDPPKRPRYTQLAYGDAWLTPVQRQEVARKRGTSGFDGRRPLLSRLRALAHAAVNDGGV